MPFAGKLRELQGIVIGALALFALTVVGLFNVAGALIGLLSEQLNPNVAAAIVGALALLPILVIALKTASSEHHKKKEKESQEAREASAFMDSDALPAGIKDILHTVQSLTRSAPFMSIAVAIVAGIVLVRFPRALPVVLGIIAAERAAL